MSRGQAAATALVPLCFVLPSLLCTHPSSVSGFSFSEFFPSYILSTLSDYSSTPSLLLLLDFSSFHQGLSITDLYPTLQTYLADPILTPGFYHHLKTTVSAM